MGGPVRHRRRAVLRHHRGRVRRGGGALVVDRDPYRRRVDSLVELGSGGDLSVGRIIVDLLAAFVGQSHSGGDERQEIELGRVHVSFSWLFSLKRLLGVVVASLSLVFSFFLVTRNESVNRPGSWGKKEKKKTGKSSPTRQENQLT